MRFGFLSLCTQLQAEFSSEIGYCVTGLRPLFYKPTEAYAELKGAITMPEPLENIMEKPHQTVYQPAQSTSEFYTSPSTKCWNKVSVFR
jgi:hypothetical protein